LTSPKAVEDAVAECQRLGAKAFREKYGFGPARRYFLDIEGERFDSKAIVGVAYGYQFPDRGPLGAHDFSGGDRTVRQKLEDLGFTVVVVART
jgi:putative restriction endonuclease